MSRVDELQKKYPNVPRDQIIQWEVNGRGIRYTETVDKVSYYDRGDLYQSRDNDVSLREMAKQKPWIMRPGFVLRTKCLYLKSGFSTRVVRDTQSPYEIKEEGPDRYGLYEGGERIEDAYFPYPKHWREEPEKEPKTSKGTPVTSLVGLNRRCFNVTAVRHCQYFDTGEQCKFCNVNATQSDAKSVGATAPLMLNLEETVEAYKIITSQMPPLVEGCVIMGGLANSELEAKIHLQFVENLAHATPYLPHISPSIETISKKDMQRLKDAGAAGVYSDIEVMDPAFFPEVCPGKSRFHGYERWLEAFQEAVEVFGFGHVCSVMPGGLTLMTDNPHKNWQEARDSHIEGIHWLIKNGVFPMLAALALGNGSIYGDNPANRAKRAPTEYYLDLTLAHHEFCKRYDMYSRMDRLMWCPLDRLSNGYGGQLGMVELCGDLGKWAATFIPDDANWIGKFIESFKAQSKTS